MKKTKNFSASPLPFMGQKRNFLKSFVKALDNYPKKAVYVDLFGGSGLLSHTVKNHFPEATVIYNDYDNFSERLQNIDKTNVLIADIRKILIDYPRNKMIVGSHRERVLARLEQEASIGYVDYLTVSSSILFSMKYFTSIEEFRKASLYNCIKRNNYDSKGYLTGVTTVSKDYKELFEQYKNVPNVVFLVDPPYLATESKPYKNYWKLSDYLNVLNVLDGSRYFYFTSNKSSIIELCDWVQNSTVRNPFANAQKVEMTASTTYSSSYTDIMVFK